MSYRVLRIEPDELEAQLNASSRDGWAVIAVVEHNYKIVVVLARPLSGQDD